MPTRVPHFNDPSHWRARAEEALAHAEQMSDLDARCAMYRVADDYLNLARRAEARVAAALKSAS